MVVMPSKLPDNPLLLPRRGGEQGDERAIEKVGLDERRGTGAGVDVLKFDNDGAGSRRDS